MAGAGVQLWWSTDHERPWWPVMVLESGLGGRSWSPAVVVHGSREALVARDGVGERPWWPELESSCGGPRITRGLGGP